MVPVLLQGVLETRIGESFSADVGVLLNKMDTYVEIYIYLSIHTHMHIYIYMHTPFYWIYKWGPSTIIRKTMVPYRRKNVWLIIFHLFRKITLFFSEQPSLKICWILSSISSVNLDVFSPWAPPTHFFYGFFPQGFLLHRTNISMCYIIWLKCGTHTYIYTALWLSWYIWIHTCIYIQSVRCVCQWRCY